MQEKKPTLYTRWNKLPFWSQIAIGVGATALMSAILFSILIFATLLSIPAVISLTMGVAAILLIGFLIPNIAARLKSPVDQIVHEPENQPLLAEEVPQAGNQKEAFNLFSSLATHASAKDLLPLICSELDEKDQKALGVTMGIAQKSDDCYSRLFTACKGSYLKTTRYECAKKLRALIMDWKYDEIEKLVALDPTVLGVRLPYQKNKWLKDEELTEFNSRELSALKFAWWTGDENFIELFERLGKGHLPRKCHENKDGLTAEWIAFRDDLAAALNDYADEKQTWSDIKSLWHDAPQWVFGLNYFIYMNLIRSESDVKAINLFCRSFRVLSSGYRRAVGGGGAVSSE